MFTKLFLDSFPEDFNLEDEDQESDEEFEFT